MKRFLIWSERTKELHTIVKNNETEVRDWVINHLDLSMNWNISTM